MLLFHTLLLAVIFESTPFLNISTLIYDHQPTIQLQQLPYFHWYSIPPNNLSILRILHCFLYFIHTTLFHHTNINRQVFQHSSLNILFHRSLKHPITFSHNHTSSRQNKLWSKHIKG